MKINIRIPAISDDILVLTVPDNATVDDLKVAARVAFIPSTNELNACTKINAWYSGHKLEHSKSLASYNITPESIEFNSNLLVYLTTNDSEMMLERIRAESSALVDDEAASVDIHPVQLKKAKTKSKSRSKSKSKKCSFLNCNSTPLRMVGDCQFCQGKFCSKHRLLESHNCKGLKICKDKCYERNALKLQSEQTVASKV